MNVKTVNTTEKSGPQSILSLYSVMNNNNNSHNNKHNNYSSDSVGIYECSMAIKDYFAYL